MARYLTVIVRVDVQNVQDENGEVDVSITGEGIPTISKPEVAGEFARVCTEAAHNYFTTLSSDEDKEWSVKE